MIVVGAPGSLRLFLGPLIALISDAAFLTDFEVINKLPG
jgi:hypothetical protein